MDWADIEAALSGLTERGIPIHAMWKQTSGGVSLQNRERMRAEKRRYRLRRKWRLRA